MTPSEKRAKRNEQQHNYRLRNLLEVRKQERARYRKQPERNWAKHTIRHHRLAGYRIAFSIAELIAFVKKARHCFLCGRKLQWTMSKHSYTGTLPNNPSLDRLTHSRTLRLSNIAIACHRCNACKNSFSLKEYVAYCARISRKFSDLLPTSARPKS